MQKEGVSLEADIFLDNMQANASFEAKEIINHAHTYEWMISLLQIGVTHDCPAFHCLLARNVSPLYLHGPHPHMKNRLF